MKFNEAGGSDALRLFPSKIGRFVGDMVHKKWFVGNHMVLLLDMVLLFTSVIGRFY
ncbi:unnamed protein product [Ectocarpus sp. 6 AP-2014]